MLPYVTKDNVIKIVKAYNKSGSDTSDYNSLSNVPIINQDLGADGFVPEVGKYYRNIGEGGPAIGTPLNTTDPVSTIYFDTTKTFTAEELYSLWQHTTDAMASTSDGFSLHIEGVDDEGTQWLIAYMDESESVEPVFIYTINLQEEGFEDGWQVSSVDNNNRTFTTINDPDNEWNSVWVSSTAFAQGSYSLGTIYRCVSISPTVEYVEIGKAEPNLLWEAGTGDHSIQTKGTGCDARGAYSLAEGNSTLAESDLSHAEGWVTRTIIDNTDLDTYGHASHAEGSHTIAKGACSHAEGNTTESMGMYSHAEGSGTISGGRSSHAEGDSTLTNNVAEHAEGSYNYSHSTKDGDIGNTLHSIGIGTSMSNRKNAIEVMQNGDVYIIGIGGYDGTNIDSAKTLQQVIAEL